MNSNTHLVSCSDNSPSRSFEQCITKLLIFVRNRKDWTLLNQHFLMRVCKILKSHNPPVAFSIAQPFTKLLPSESAKSSLFSSCFRHVTTRAVLLPVYYQSQTDHRPQDIASQHSRNNNNNNCCNQIISQYRSPIC